MMTFSLRGMLFTALALFAFIALSFGVASAQQSSYTVTDPYTGLVFDIGLPGINDKPEINVSNGTSTWPFIFPFEACALTVVKHVVGGTAEPSDFLIHVMKNGSEITGSPQSGSQSGDTYAPISTGSYMVSETRGPAGYVTTFSGDCDASGHVTLSLDEKARCVVTNTFSGGGGNPDPGPATTTPSQITGTLTGGVSSTTTAPTSTPNTGGGTLSGTVVNPSLGGSVTGTQLSGTVVTPGGGGGSLGGTVTSPGSGGGGGGGSSGGGGGTSTGSGGSSTTTDNPIGSPNLPGIPNTGDQVLPGIPNTGIGGDSNSSLAVLLISFALSVIAAIALWSPGRQAFN